MYLCYVYDGIKLQQVYTEGAQVHAHERITVIRTHTKRKRKGNAVMRFARSYWEKRRFPRDATSREFDALCLCKYGFLKRNVHNFLFYVTYNCFVILCLYKKKAKGFLLFKMYFYLFLSFPHNLLLLEYIRVVSIIILKHHLNVWYLGETCRQFKVFYFAPNLSSFYGTKRFKNFPKVLQRHQNVEETFKSFFKICDITEMFTNISEESYGKPGKILKSELLKGSSTFLWIEKVSWKCQESKQTSNNIFIGSKSFVQISGALKTYDNLSQASRTMHFSLNF